MAEHEQKQPELTQDQEDFVWVMLNIWASRDIAEIFLTEVIKAWTFEQELNRIKNLEKDEGLKEMATDIVKTINDYQRKTLNNEIKSGTPEWKNMIQKIKTLDAELKKRYKEIYGSLHRETNIQVTALNIDINKTIMTEQFKNVLVDIKSREIPQETLSSYKTWLESIVATYAGGKKETTGSAITAISSLKQELV